MAPFMSPAGTETFKAGREAISLLVIRLQPPVDQVGKFFLGKLVLLDKREHPWLVGGAPGQPGEFLGEARWQCPPADLGLHRRIEGKKELQPPADPPLAPADAMVMPSVRSASSMALTPRARILAEQNTSLAVRSSHTMT